MSLRSLVRRYLLPPDLGSVDRNRLAARLHYILIALTLMLGALTVAYLLLDIEQLNVPLWIVAGSIAVCLSALWLLRRNHLRLAGGIFLTFLFTAASLVVMIL